METKKKFYEVAIMQHVTGSTDDDFETIFFDSDNYTYKKSVKIAKEKSLKYDACDVICYTKNNQTLYNEIYREQYIKGEKQFRMYL